MEASCVFFIWEYTNIKNPNSDQDRPNYSLIIGVGTLIFIAYVYFLSTQDSLGYLASGAFFVLYAAEHVYNFIDRTDRKLGSFNGVSYQRIIAFGAPCAALLIGWLISLVI